MIQFQGVTKQYGVQTILHETSFEIPAGHFEVTGPNGAGKTTLMRMAAGISRPTTGTIVAPNAMYLPAQPPLYPELTPLEHLAWWARMHQLPRQAGLDMAQDANLESFAAKPCRSLSSGQKQRTSLALAFLADRPFLLLDEPETTLDDQGQAWLHERVNARRADHFTWIATHKPSEKRRQIKVVDGTVEVSP